MIFMCEWTNETCYTSSRFVLCHPVQVQRSQMQIVRTPPWSSEHSLRVPFSAFRNSCFAKVQAALGCKCFHADFGPKSMTDSSCERSMPLVTLLDLCNCIQVICACHPTPEQRIQRFALLLWVVQHSSLPNCFETLQTQMVRPLWDPLKKAPGFWDCPVSPFTSKPLPKEFLLGEPSTFPNSAENSATQVRCNSN